MAKVTMLNINIQAVKDYCLSSKKVDNDSQSARMYPSYGE